MHTHFNVPKNIEWFGSYAFFVAKINKHKKKFRSTTEVQGLLQIISFPI